MTLNEIAARWLGYRIVGYDGNKLIIAPNTESYSYFLPLTDRNDLVRVEEKLPKWYEILITKGEFYIRCTRVAGGVHSFGYVASGNYPTDYPTALLELVKTLYEGKER